METRRGNVKFHMRSLSLRGDSLRVCQRLQESDQVFDLGLVELGVKAHRVAQRRETAVVHVRRGARHVAQPRDAEAHAAVGDPAVGDQRAGMASAAVALADEDPQAALRRERIDRKSTRLNSSHGYISYAVFCLKKKKQ